MSTTEATQNSSLNSSLNETIKTGRKYRVCYDSTPGAKKWYRLSHWTAASDVELEGGKTLADTLVSGDTSDPSKTNTIIRYVKGDNPLNPSPEGSSLKENDSINNGSQDRPYYSIQRALDDAPLVNGNAEFRIVVQGGDTFEHPYVYHNFIVKNTSVTLVIQGTVTLTGSHSEMDNGTENIIEVDAATLKIIGDTTTQDNLLCIESAGSDTTEENQTELLRNKANLIYIHNGGRINAYKVPFHLIGNREGDAPEQYEGNTGIYIVSDGGFSLTEENISFQQLYRGLCVSTNSIFYADELYGAKNVSNTNVKLGILCNNGGQVAYKNNYLEADTKEQTDTGGRIYTGSQETTNSNTTEG